MGKRVNFSARSVITRSQHLSRCASQDRHDRDLPETVTAHNIDRLRDMVFNGPNNYPGARNVWQNGISIDLRRAEKRIRMEISEGDVVDRHLLNGDYVLFNRQPSLHRMSMMAHKVRVMPYDTFRLSVMVTPPLQRRFRGDEMMSCATVGHD
jgi:DNA-directed RNA polymerase II subunit RPB1